MSDVLKTKTYEVPICTVCMEELTESLSSISCGHVFHTHCIVQSLEFKSQCPNCRKKSTAKELRDMTYSIVIRSEDKDRIQFLESLKQADQENYLKLITQNDEMHRELKIKTRKVEDLKEEIVNKQNLLTSQGEMIAALHNEKRDWKIDKQSLILQKEAVEIENEKIIKENRDMEKRLQTLEREVKDYERLKRIVESANDNEDEFLKSLRERSSAQEQAKTFYEFLRIKKGELKKAKDELQRLYSEVAQYKQRISSLEAALQKKPQPSVSSEKHPERLIESKKRSYPEDRMIPEKRIITNKHLNSNLEIEGADVLFKKTPNSDLDFSSLGKDLLNTSFLDNQDKNTQEKESTPKKTTDSARQIRSLIYPQGMTKIGQGLKVLNRQVSQQTSEQAKTPVVRSSFHDLIRQKSNETVALKKVKLTEESLGLKPVQQKINSFVAKNS